MRRVRRIAGNPAQGKETNMKIVVWHINSDVCEAKGIDVREVLFHGDKDSAKRAWEHRVLEPVAVWDVGGFPGEDWSAYQKHLTFELEQAFRWTQHISGTWNEPGAHEKLKPMRSTANRSTSVGDIFEVYEGTLRKALYLCAAVGFERLDNPEVEVEP